VVVGAGALTLGSAGGKASSHLRRVGGPFRAGSGSAGSGQSSWSDLLHKADPHDSPFAIPLRIAFGTRKRAVCTTTGNPRQPARFLVRPTTRGNVEVMAWHAALDALAKESRGDGGCPQPPPPIHHCRCL